MDALLPTTNPRNSLPELPHSSKSDIVLQELLARTVGYARSYTSAHFTNKNVNAIIA